MNCNIFVDEVQSGLDIRTEVQQSLSRGLKSRRQTSRQLGEGDIELSPVGGIDHAQDGFGLSQVEASGQEGPQGEFTRLRQSSPGLTQGPQSRLQQRWRSQQVDLGGRLPGITARAGPEIEQAGDPRDGFGHPQSSRRAPGQRAAPGQRLRRCETCVAGSQRRVVR